MKQKITLVFGLVITLNLQAQEPPTGTLPANNTASKANAAWYRGGNTNDINNNIFGTLWNSPIYTQTEGLNRAKLNGRFIPATQYQINGYGFGNTQQTVNTSGYYLIGANGNSITDGLNLYNRKGAFSLLHLNGATASNEFQEFGFRSWMKTGITFTGNRDLSYMGLRALGLTEDITETTIAWSDNNNATNPGPDDMVFRFTSGGGAPTLYNGDFSVNSDFDGLHVSRFTGNGLMGLGNTFGINVEVPPGTYNTPRSLLHMSYQYRTGVANEQYGFMQITYRRPNGALQDSIGQGEQATDGLRLGIDNDLFGNPGSLHLNSYLRWQEASSFIIQTEDDLTPNIQSNERLRVTSIGALRRNHGVSYVGLPNPSGTTRVSISESGTNPLTRPLSLLHLGYNYNVVNAAGIPVTNNGWRPWMDLGMLTSNARDHVFVGLKPRDSLALAIGTTNDKLDAVIAWGSTGENLSANPGPDVMRFIFTSDTLDAIESDLSKSYNGLEVMRLFPSADTTTAILNRTYGRVGIGDFTSQGVNEQPTHKLDVVGNGRFRGLPDSLYIADSTVNKIVMVDSNGVLRWATALPSGLACWDVNGNGVQDAAEDVNFDGAWDALDCQGPTGPAGPQGPAGAGAAAHNGTALSTFDPTKVALGQDVGQGGNPAILLNNREIPMNQQQVNFNDGFVNVNSVAGEFNVAGLNVRPANTGFSLLPYSPWFGSRALNVVNTNQRPIGIEANAIETSGSAYAIGVIGSASSTSESTVVGVDGYGDGKNFAAGQAYNSVIGVRGNSRDSKGTSIAIQGVADGNAVNAYGLYGWARGSSINAYGVYGQTASSTAPNQWAGYFDGNVHVNGQLTIPSGIVSASDAMFKTNVQPLGNAMTLISQLHPKTYDYNASAFPTFGFEADQQMGLIAQEVETVIPAIVTNHISPAKYDSLGTLISPEFAYKGVEYQELIPLLVAGMQEQQTEITNRDSVINAQQTTIDDLNNRLTQLENCLSGILPYLCQMSQSAIEANTPQEQEAVRTQLSVQLSNRSTIVLDQNVPNPFAEQTVINFSIPETVQKAQIHFYDGNGKLIQSVDVNERGLGSLTVFGSDLSRGTYTYTLVADGVIVATKKMMKQ